MELIKKYLNEQVTEEVRSMSLPTRQMNKRRASQMMIAHESNPYTRQGLQTKKIMKISDINIHERGRGVTANMRLEHPLFAQLADMNDERIKSERKENIHVILICIVIFMYIAIYIFD